MIKITKNLKRIFIVCIVMIILSSGCGKKEDISDSLQESSDVVDVDLTAMSATMIYSEVYNMMMDPDKYIGKTVKMDGLFSQYYDEQTQKYYFACIVQDATACCAQGIEFELNEDYKFPQDYPSDNEIITIVGKFDTYMEGSNQYCTLRDAKLL